MITANFSQLIIIGLFFLIGITALYITYIVNKAVKENKK